MVVLHRLNPSEGDFRDLILRYGGKQSLAKIQQMWQDFVR